LPEEENPGESRRLYIVFNARAGDWLTGVFKLLNILIIMVLH